jgi:predicted  nucleic acid-binding Zn-ribbon protein
LKDKIKLLAQLQECDNRIQDVLRGKEIGPQLIQKLMDELKANDLKLQELAEQLELCKKDRRKLEQEVQELDARIQKSQVKLSNIKSNKEYTAALKEIEDLKKMKFDTEDKIIHVMEKIEDTEKEIDTQRQMVQDLKVRSDKEKKDIEKNLLLLDQDLTSQRRSSQGFGSGTVEKISFPQRTQRWLGGQRCHRRCVPDMPYGPTSSEVQ